MLAGGQGQELPGRKVAVGAARFVPARARAILPRSQAFSLVLIATEELKTLPVGVNDLFNATIVDWGLIMAAGVVITVPTIAFFVAVQRYLVQGWGAGGVKG